MTLVLLNSVQSAMVAIEGMALHPLGMVSVGMLSSSALGEDHILSK